MTNTQAYREARIEARKLRNAQQATLAEAQVLGEKALVAEERARVLGRALLEDAENGR